MYRSYPSGKGWKRASVAKNRTMEKTRSMLDWVFCLDVVCPSVLRIALENHSGDTRSENDDMPCA